MFKKKTLLCGLFMILCGFSLSASVIDSIKDLGSSVFDSILDFSSVLYASGGEDAKAYENLQKKISGINSPKDCEKLNEEDTSGFTAFQYIAMTPGTDDLFRLALDKYSNYMPSMLSNILNDPISNINLNGIDYIYGDYKWTTDITLINFSVFLYVLINEGVGAKVNFLLNDSRFNNVINYNVEGKIETPDQSFRYRALTYAVRNGNKKLVDFLLQKNVIVNYTTEKSELDSNGKPAHFTNLTPLIESLLIPDFNKEIIKALINKNADINAGCTLVSESENYENYSPIFIAINKNDYNLFETIFSLYSDPASKRIKVLEKNATIEYSPLHWAINKKKINEPIVERLFDAATSQQTVKKDDGKSYTAAELLFARKDISPAFRKRVKNVDSEVKAFDAIESTDYEKLHSVLESGMSANVFKNNYSAFECAVKKAKERRADEESLKIVEDLLNHGAKVNAICSGGKTMFVSLILEAIDKGLDDTTKKLLLLLGKYHVDANLPVEDNLPVLHCVVNSIGQRIDTELLGFLLQEDFKLDVNQRVQGGQYNNWTPFLFAIKNGNSDIVQFLIEKGAKVNIIIKQDESTLITPLAFALIHGQEKCANLLLDNGAIQTDTVSIWGADKVSMLMLACASTDWSMVSRFLDNPKLKINNFDSQGKNAFMYAAQYNKDPVKAIKILRNLRGRKAVITHKDINGNNAYTLGFINKQDGDTLLWLLEHGVPFQYKVSNIEMYLDNVEYYNVLKEICNIKE